jgi:hypothetical protein
MPLSRLYLGHFGICNKPEEIMNNAFGKMQQLLDIGAEYKDCDSQEIIDMAMTIRMPEAEKLRMARGPELYEYISQELIPSMSKAFADYILSTV